MRYFFILILMLFVVSCASFLSIDEMIVDMNRIQRSKNAPLNVLWYEGSDDKYHYFSYVYAMMGSRRYKVPFGDVFIEKTIPYTTDSGKYIPVAKIGNNWQASYDAGNEWKNIIDGISIEIK